MAWFDARQFDPAQGSSNLPVGRHLVVIKSGARVPVKDKPNEGLLLFGLEIVHGTHTGVTGQYRLNMWNANPQSAEIAAKQLSAICHVVNHYDLESPIAQELWGKPFHILVEQQPPPNEKYTQIVGVQDQNGNAPVKGQAPQAAPQGQPTTMQYPQQPVQPPQQPPQQPVAATAPTWQPPGVGGAPQQPMQPAAPSWGAPQGQPPMQQPQQPAQPSWSQQPTGQAPGAPPSWAGR